MKLRNKKTGEIVDTLCEYDCTKGLCFGVDHHDGNPTMTCYNSLAELNEEWEDYEEPKPYWYIDFDGEIDCDNNIDLNRTDSIIGNYFETKEEAEKAVEKLKAWKRLKDGGFRFYKKWDSKEPEGYFYHVEIYGKMAPVPTNAEFMKDLDLLFGGKE